MSSLAEIKILIQDMNKNILDAISKINKSSNDTGEMAAAKIINELSAKIDQLASTKGLAEQQPANNQQIIPADTLEASPSTLFQYSYPNYAVGNENLGTGKAKGSLKWPFKKET